MAVLSESPWYQQILREGERRGIMSGIGFPPGWTVAEGDSLVTQSFPQSPNGLAEK